MHMDVTRILPPREKEGEQVATGVRLPKTLLDRLDEIGESENYSRNEVILHFLKWALEEYEAEKKPKR
jgi:metal-responsive CopG/Arc/MetJ family transcriptional regulator